MKGFEEKEKGLSKKERKLWSMIAPQSGTLYIKSKPGLGKSAGLRCLAEKLGLHYIDLRLSMVDETDIGLYPTVSMEGKTRCIDYVVPRWAIEANEKPTLIHFEELNRARLPIRNAALQLLNERAIGMDFKFNKNVFMVSSGNLGEDDGCDVEEFDSALNGRLIHMDYDMNLNEWVDAFAGKNVISTIVNYLKANPEEYYKKGDAPAYASPRTWTFFSDFLKNNIGETPKLQEVIEYSRESGFCFIGNSVTKFLRYCEDMNAISINDIIHRFDDVKKSLKNFNRDIFSDLLNNLKKIDIETLTDDNIKNIVAFLKTLSDDEQVSYLVYLLDEIFKLDGENKNCKEIFKAFDAKMKKIKTLQ